MASTLPPAARMEWVAAASRRDLAPAAQIGACGSLAHQLLERAGRSEVAERATAPVAGEQRRLANCGYLYVPLRDPDLLAMRGVDGGSGLGRGGRAQERGGARKARRASPAVLLAWNRCRARLMGWAGLASAAATCRMCLRLFSGRHRRPQPLSRHCSRSWSLLVGLEGPGTALNRSMQLAQHLQAAELAPTKAQAAGKVGGGLLTTCKLHGG